MKSGRFCFLGVLAAFCLVLSAGQGILQASEKKEVTIGYATSMTGRFSVEGSEVNRGYQLWLGEINEAGGLQVGDKKYPIKVIHYDDESNSSTCSKLYEKLITRDKVDLTLSPWSSGMNFAASAVVEKYHYPMIMSSAAAIKIFDRGFHYIFETTPLTSTMMEPWRGFLEAHRDKIKTVAILYENFLFTLALNQSLVKYVKEAGAKLVLHEKYPIGGKDFAGLLLKVKGANPDALMVLNIFPASVYATRQANEVGVAPKLFMVNNGPTQKKEYIEALGKLSEKVYETGYWHPELPYPGAKEFVTKFQTKFSRTPPPDAAWAYISCQILEQAIKKAGTIDREQLTKTLHSAKFSTINGSYEYDERGVNKDQSGFLAQVQNKERVIVWPKEVANADSQFMR